MDEGLDDEVSPIDVAENPHIQSKESEYMLKHESGNVLESREMLIPGDNDFSPSSPGKFAEILDGRNLNRISSSGIAFDHPCSSSHSMDDAVGVMVQELRVKNYNSSNLAIVGSSNNRERMQTKQNQWHQLYHPGGGSGSVRPHGDTVYRDKGLPVSSAWEEVGCMPFREFMGKRLSNKDQNRAKGQLGNTDNKEGSVNVLSHGGIRTKMLSKSGFSEFFVKNTLKGKGIICRGPPRDSFQMESRDESNIKAAHVSSSVKSGMPSSHDIIGPSPRDPDHSGFTLSQWLKAGRQRVNKVESLYILKQVVDMVDVSHSNGVVLHDLRPSCFLLLPYNRVKYVGSHVRREMVENFIDKDIRNPENCLIGKRPLDQGMNPSVGPSDKKQKFGKSTIIIKQWPQFPSISGLKPATPDDSNLKIAGHQDSHGGLRNLTAEYDTPSKSISSHLSNTAKKQLISVREQLEEKWYTSPEELNEGSCTMSSNIYCLGVLLFEFLAHFDSEKAHAAAMLDLRHRILPPIFLSENPKEAGFCIWLLHPEPSSRPTTREILESEVFRGLQEVRAEELSSSIENDDAGSELLLHFLTSLKEQKDKNASKLVHEIRCLEADVEEVERRHGARSCMLSGDSHNSRFLLKKDSTSDVVSRLSSVCDTNEFRSTRNINQLESAYFSERSKIQLPESDATVRQDKDLLTNRENWSMSHRDEGKHRTDCLGAFFNGFCKYARYSKFEVCSILRNGDLNNSSNVICSLSFDRDEEFFAAAGVSKKIKIYEFNALFNDSVDIHYPVIEMPNESKLSCVSWNSYIRNYLASSDYDGVVKLWDACTGQGFSQYLEHQKRAWSVDFSQVDPTKLASGSDDCSVKLWSVNERNCLDTIKSIANVCCVQFSRHSTNLLAFGSADYKTYCYDLRNTKAPWCVLAGHGKAVSYVKFLDSETLVSASTDNTLKIWDLNKTNSSGVSTDACSLTLCGHTNEKNFVGLSIADGYVVCGSETNEVYAYYRSLPMPIASCKFGSLDPISGKEIDDDNGQFVSSVCWRGKSDMVVAANSSGCIKVLKMV